MSIFKKAWKKVKKTAAKALGVDTKAKAPKPDAQLGPSGAGDATSRAASEAARRRQRRSARGRDSTIIAMRSELGSRTLLG
jgi:hypothetical protein